MPCDKAHPASNSLAPLEETVRVRGELGAVEGTHTEPERVGEPVVVAVTAEHHVIQAWQTARALAEANGFGRVFTYYVVTSVAELANNLWLHATRGGVITLASIRRDGCRGIEIVAEDEGPGIADVARAMQDGFSTIGSLGSGLPGVARLMDECEISSALGVGTRVVARKWQPCA